MRARDFIPMVGLRASHIGALSDVKTGAFFAYHIVSTYFLMLGIGVWIKGL